jgi:hypothetical protein
MMLSGSGFTPQGLVALSASGQQLTTIYADPDGGFSIRVETPSGLFGMVRLRFTAADASQLSLRASTTVWITDTDVVVTPTGGAPARLRRIRAWGFFGADAVYAHVKRHGAPRARNIRLGEPRGACGTLDVQRRLFHRSVRPGSYTLQFDALRRYYPNLVSSVSYYVGVFGPSTTHTASERPGGLPPSTPLNPPRVKRVARFTTTSRSRVDPFLTGASSRH